MSGSAAYRRRPHQRTPRRRTKLPPASRFRGRELHAASHKSGTILVGDIGQDLWFNLSGSHNVYFNGGQGILATSARILPTASDMAAGAGGLQIGTSAYATASYQLTAPFAFYGYGLERVERLFAYLNRLDRIGASFGHRRRCASFSGRSRAPTPPPPR